MHDDVAAAEDGDSQADVYESIFQAVKWRMRLCCTLGIRILLIFERELVRLSAFVAAPESLHPGFIPVLRAQALDGGFKTPATSIRMQRSFKAESVSRFIKIEVAALAGIVR